MTWLSCLCYWIPSQEKQGILECTPSSGTYMPLPVVTVQPAARCRPAQYLYELLAPQPKPPPCGPGHVHHDAAGSGATAPSLVEVAEARHMERLERQRQEREARQDAAAARTRITSAYGSRMLKVGPSAASRTPTPTSPAFPVTAGLPDSRGEHATDTPVREVQHGYGTFGPSPVPILGLGRPGTPPATIQLAASPKRRTSRPPRAPRPPRSLTVRVPVVPLDSVRRTVTEMLFNVPSSPVTTHRGAAALRPPMCSPTETPRVCSVTLTPADRAAILAAASHEIRQILTAPDTPLTPAAPTLFTPETPYTPATPFSPFAAVDSPVSKSAPSSTKGPVRTPPESLRGRAPKRQATHRRSPSSAASVNTQPEETGYVVYKQIGLSGLPAPRRCRSKPKVRIAD